MADFFLTVIGAGSALPMHGRHPSSQVLQYDDVYCMIDCGEGTQMRMKETGVRPFKIKVIFISHLHGDHFFGLPGLLSTFSHLQRKEELTVFGPPGIKPLLDEIRKYTELKINYPLQVVEVSPASAQSIWHHGNIEVLAFPLDHRIACNGYLIKEKSPVTKIRKERIRNLSLTIEQLQALRRGEDIVTGKVKIPNAELTYGADRILSYAYCSDTRYNERIIPWIRSAAILYHETTFENELLDMAEHTGHTTAGDAGRMAKEAGVKWLITGHYSSRYKTADGIMGQASVHFPNVLEAVEGRKYNLRELALQDLPE